MDLQTWTQTALADLAAAQQSNGGWPYALGRTSNSEVTSLAALALAALAPESSRMAGAVGWLGQRQLEGGAFTLSGGCPEASWVTPLSALALARCAQGAEQAVATAVDYLLSEAVFSLDPTPWGLYGYDTTIPGWPWTPGAYSFVEPTSLAVIFLKQQGQTEHLRVRQSVDMLHARAVAAGGWNYGESVVLNNNLHPAAAPTAAALLALADEQDEVAAAAVDWLASQRGQITSLFSLAWATMAMNVLGEDADNWTAEVVALWNATSETRRTVLDTALCLLAVAPREEHPFAIGGQGG